MSNVAEGTNLYLPAKTSLYGLSSVVPGAPVLIGPLPLSHKTRASTGLSASAFCNSTIQMATEILFPGELETRYILNQDIPVAKILEIHAWDSLKLDQARDLAFAACNQDPDYNIVVFPWQGFDRWMIPKSVWSRHKFYYNGFTVHDGGRTIYEFRAAPSARDVIIFDFFPQGAVSVGVSEITED